MEIDPMEVVKEQKEREEKEEKEEKEKKQAKEKSWLNALIAVTVALLATFIGICSVKAGNIVVEMQQAQAERIDNFSWLQARNIRATVAQATADTLRAQIIAAPPAAKAAFQKQIAAYAKLAADQNEKKNDQEKKAHEAELRYKKLKFRDEQLDVAEALISLAVALFAMTSLTQKHWLYGIALIPTLIGVVMGLAGLFGWGIQLTAVSRFLS